MNFKKIIQAIKKNKTFLIAAHVNADADALAAELAMAAFLKSLKKNVLIVNAEKPMEMFSFFPYIRMIEEFHGQKLAYDMVVILDCGSLDRIDCVQKMIKDDIRIVNIDHHITNDHFGDYNLVVPQASSTCEILFDLFKIAGFKLTKEVAKLLYLGIMTDTGSFRYDSTTAHTHAITSDLLSFGFSVSEMFRKSYENISLKDLRQFAKIIEGFEVTHNGRAISVQLTKNMIKKFSGNFDLRDKIFNFLRAIKGVEVVVIFTEFDQNRIRINFRSQGKVDVAKLASLFGGGGHRRASGCRMKGDMRQSKQKIYEQLEKILK